MQKGHGIVHRNLFCLSRKCFQLISVFGEMNQDDYLTIVKVLLKDFISDNMFATEYSHVLIYRILFPKGYNSFEYNAYDNMFAYTMYIAIVI